MKKGDRQIKRIVAALDKFVGEGEYPREVTGSLSMLIDYLESGSKLLNQLMAPSRVKKPEDLVLAIELHVEELEAICKQLKKPLSRVRRKAYAGRRD